MKKLLALLSLVTILSSCSDDVKLLPYSQYAGPNCNNNYQRYGKFFKEYHKVSGAEVNIEKGDSVVINAKGAVIPPLSVSENEIVVADKSGKIFLMTFISSLWNYQLPENVYPVGTMAADLDKNIYFVTSDDNLYSIDIKGELRWKKPLLTHTKRYYSFTDLIAGKSGLLVGCSNGEIIKYGFDGSEVWRYQTELAPIEIIAETNSEQSIVGLTHNEFGVSDSLLLFDKKGKVLWQKEIKNTRLIQKPAYGNNLIYVGGLRERASGQGRDSYIMAFDTLGNMKWEAELPAMLRNIATDNEGNAYITAYNAGIGQAKTGIYCYDSTGNRTWHQYLNIAVPIAPMVANYEIALVGSTPETFGVFFIQKDEGNMYKTLSLSNAPIVNMQPTVSEHGNIIFAGADSLLLVRTEDTQLNKILD